jgi:excisionase family DNA binding protein
MTTFSSSQIRDLRELIAEVVRIELRHFSPKAAEAGKAIQAGPDDNSGPLVSRAEAARQLGVSVQTIAKLIRLNQLPSVQVGRRRLIRRSDLVRLISRPAQRLGGVS